MESWIIACKINSSRLIREIKDKNHLVAEGIATNNENLWFENPVRQLYLEGKRRGHNIQVLNAADINFTLSASGTCQFFVKGEKREIPTLVIPRTGSGTRNFDIALYKQLELLGVRMVNTSDSIVAAMDKFYSMQLLAQQGLPIPKTMFIGTKVDIQNVQEHFTFPIIVKVWPSSEGDGVMLASDKHNLMDIISLVRKANPEANLLIQEYISNSKGKDIRVVTLNNEVLYMAERRAMDDGYKSNLARGGEVVPLEDIEAVKTIALKAAKALRLEHAGIDILYDVGSYKICEVNSAPGFGIAEKIGFSMPKMLYNYLEKNIQ